MRGLRYALLPVALVASMLLAPAAEAQELRLPGARQGYYLGGGLRNAMTFGSTEDAGGLGFVRGFGFAFRFGQMANEWLGLGLAIASGGGASSNWAVGGGSLTLEVQVKPLDNYDLALRGGIGIGAFGLTRPEPELETEDDPSGGFGAQYVIGASYDLFPFYDKKKYESGGFAFTGFFEVAILPTSQVWTTSIIVGLEATYWFGLGKNKLELPPDEAFKYED